MEWKTVLIEWVNCLRLTGRPIEKVCELCDGEFFSKVLEIRFDKIVSVNDIPTVFDELRMALEGEYLPKNWIDFNAASTGDVIELVKILSVLLATCSLQDQATLFQENPTTSLKSMVQIEIKEYLQLVLQNSKVVSEELFASLSLPYGKENARTSCYKGFKKRNAVSWKLPDPPHIYQPSHLIPAQPNVREREVTDMERLQAEAMEKLNSELLSKSSCISELETRISELSNKLDSKNVEIKDLDDKCSNLMECITDLKKTSETLTMDLQRKSFALVEAKEQLNELKSLYNQTEDENDKLIRDSRKLKTDYDSLLERTQQVEEELEITIRFNAGRIDELTKDLEDKTESLKNSHENNMVLESKCTHLQHVLETTKINLEEAKLNLEKSEEEFCCALNQMSLDLEKERDKTTQAEENVKTHLKMVQAINEEIAKLKDNCHQCCGSMQAAHSTTQICDEIEVEEKLSEDEEKCEMLLCTWIKTKGVSGLGCIFVVLCILGLLTGIPIRHNGCFTNPSLFGGLENFFKHCGQLSHDEVPII